MAEALAMRLKPILPRQFGQRAMNLVEPLGYALPPCASGISSAVAVVIPRSFLVEAMPRFGNVNSSNIVGCGLREWQRQQQQSEQPVPCPPLPHIQPRVSMDSGYSIELLAEAYSDCRRHKRNTDSALRFEQNLEHNLVELHEELLDGSYRPWKSICFAITRPKPREVWAATFKDRIVHHLLYNRIAPRFIARFIADSCACIPGRGTLYAAQRLESKIRSQTQNWSRPGYYLKADLANFFVIIDKRILWTIMERHITDNPWWSDLARTILFHDPRDNYEIRGNRNALAAVPAHKRLANAGEYCGLPIGNLSSQFFANVLLNELDLHVKHSIRGKHYIRYVDDFILLHESAQWLNDALDEINAYLPSLGLALNPTKTILQPIARGVDFVGQVIKPWHRVTRKRTVNEALRRVKEAPADDLFETANSYYGLLRQATSSHHQRAKLSNILRYRGHAVSGNLTKIYRRKAA